MKLQLAYQSVQPTTSKPVYNLASLPVTWFDVSDSDVTGLDGLILTDSREEGNQVMRKISGDITCRNATKDLILYEIYNNNAQYMWVRIYDCECNSWIFRGQIQRDKIEWCSNGCDISTRFSEYDEVTDAYLSLNNVLDYDNYLTIGEHFLNFPIRFSSGVSQYFRYMEGVRIGGLLEATIENSTAYVFISSIVNRQTDLNGWTGDNYNYTPSSSTLQQNLNPYYHAYLLNDDISKPLKESEIGNKIRFEHRYTKTTKQFLEMLKPLFNADYLIKKVGSVVQFIFERKDYFYNNSVIWKDCSDYNACFEIDDRNMFAYANMQWQSLSFGEEQEDVALYKELYNNIVEWNNPVNPLQKDEYTSFLGFAWMPLFGFYVNSEMEDCLNLRKKDMIAPPSICIAGENFSSSGEFNNVYLGSYDTTKYIGRVHKANSALWFNGDVAQATSETGYTSPSLYLADYEDCNLYDNFHFVENPRNIANHRGVYGKYQRKWLRFSLEIDFTCEEFLSFQNDSSIYINVFGTKTKALVNTIEWTFRQNGNYRGTAKINGII